MSASLFTILVLPLSLMGIALLAMIAKLILGPISRAAGFLKAPVRFRLSDFFWLVIQFQLVLGAASQLNTGNDSVFGFITLVSLGATLALWIGAISCVSKAGVTNGWRRGVFIIFQLPATLAVMIGIPCLLLPALMISVEMLADPPTFRQSTSIATVSRLYLSVFFLIAIGVGLRFLTHWILSGSEPISVEKLDP